MEILKTSYSNAHKGIIKRLISMHYKIGRANQLRKDYEIANNFKYDVVIRARPDIRHNKMLKMSDYEINSSNCYLDKDHSYHYVSDQFAFGTPEVMDIYSSLYEHILPYSQTIAVYYAEATMQHHLKTNKINVKHVNLDYKVVGLTER